MTKTLGQVAYDAWLVGAHPAWARWDGLEPHMQKHWQAAAEAVFREMQRRYAKEPRLRDNWLDEADRFGLFDRRFSAERAVIEAAKALHEAWMEEWDPSDPRLHPVHVRFKLAVDEMLTVEVEGE